MYSTGIDYRARLLYDYDNSIIFLIISYLRRVHEPHYRRHLGREGRASEVVFENPFKGNEESSVLIGRPSVTRLALLVNF